MPDSDIVRRGLAGRYSTPYKQMIEGQAPVATIANGFARGITRGHCKKPEFASTLRALHEALDKHRGPWEELHAVRDRVLSKSGLGKRTINILADSFNAFVEHARQQRTAINPNELCRVSAARLYDADIGAPIAANSGPHYAAARADVVRAKSDEARALAVPLVERHLRRILGVRGLPSLSLPKPAPKTAVAADTDFLTLLSRASDTGSHPELPY